MTEQRYVPRMIFDVTELGVVAALVARLGGTVALTDAELVGLGGSLEVERPLDRDEMVLLLRAAVGEGEGDEQTAGR